MATFARNDADGDIIAALASIRNRLDTLDSISAENILIPGGPQERYHQLVEEAYATLGLIETQVDELRTELEYQHKRLPMKTARPRSRCVNGLPRSGATAAHARRAFFGYDVEDGQPFLVATEADEDEDDADE